ncbi:hypothetical protein pb186bvf_020012 [Paramecium bursaria]
MIVQLVESIDTRKIYENNPQLLAELLKQNQKDGKISNYLIRSNESIREQDDIFFFNQQQNTQNFFLNNYHRPNDLPYQQYICFLLLFLHKFLHKPSIYFFSIILFIEGIYIMRQEQQKFPMNSQELFINEKMQNY